MEQNQLLLAASEHFRSKKMLLRQKTHPGGFRVECPGVLILNTAPDAKLFQPMGRVHLRYQETRHVQAVSIGHSYTGVIRTMAYSTMTKPQNSQLYLYDVCLMDAAVRVMQGKHENLLFVLDEGDAVIVENGVEHQLLFRCEPAYNASILETTSKSTSMEVNGEIVYTRFRMDEHTRVLSVNNNGNNTYQLPISVKRGVEIAFERNKFSHTLDLLSALTQSPFHLGIYQHIREEVLVGRIKHLAANLSTVAAMRQENISTSDVQMVIEEAGKKFLQRKTTVSTEEIVVTQPKPVFRI